MTISSGTISVVTVAELGSEKNSNSIIVKGMKKGVRNCNLKRVLESQLAQLKSSLSNRFVTGCVLLVE
ncbi:hypothetical protein K0M31_015737 [Melipona bicolor]|uniref:Uncharacterized protein n=1 Tax=Melipona bicolor TaxID=60889 RepID=A0AA40FF00_9HYME|nr:hypothetical protein K0M31_015737 [Melipona bicolor]